MTKKSARHAAVIIRLADNNRAADATEDQKIIALSRQVSASFRHQDPAQIALYKIRPYITNKRLPAFIRFPNGAMETVIQAGLCDNASRMLAFVLRREGYSSVQWNMVTARGGHSARLVTLSDGRKVFIDPFYGFVAMDPNGRLTDMQSAQERINAGDTPESTPIPLGKGSDAQFYRDLDRMFMAAEGEKLIIKAKIPLTEGHRPLVLGVRDGQENDVKNAAQTMHMTPYWFYVGHKYNREWVRQLQAQEPVKITMSLVRRPTHGVLTASPAPAIEGKTLTWHLKAGDTLTFQDGLAKISLERLNSYINVDQIVITPQNAD